MSILKKIVQSPAKLVTTISQKTKVDEVVKDVAKSAAIIPNQSYKSITGEDLFKNAASSETKVGSVLIGVNKLGIDTGHKALQAYANTVSGGLASKAHEKIVPGIVQKQAEDYNTKIFTDIKPLSKVEDISKKAAPIIGAIAPSVLKPKPTETSVKSPTNVSPKISTVAPSSSGLLNSVVSQPTTQTKTVGLFQDITAGYAKANEATGGAIGQLANSALKSVIQNALTPKSAPSQAPQIAAVGVQQAVAPTILTQPSKLTLPQQAMFKTPGSGVSITLNDQGISGSAGTQETWWEKNKMIVIGVSIVIAPLLLIYFFATLFRRRR